MPRTIKGIITAMVTPFDRKNALNGTVIKEMVHHQVSEGANAVLIAGGSGEYVNLSCAEREQAIKAAAMAANGRLAVIAGILEPSTQAALEAIHVAARAGADAVMVISPYYLNVSEDGVYAHFETIARACSLPIILYNTPSRTNFNLSADLLLRLSRIENIIGIKECDRDIGRVTLKIEATREHLAFFAGDDDLFFPMLVLGGKGAVLATANLAPRWGNELMDAFSQGNLQRCLVLHTKLTKLLYAFYRANHPAPLKAALTMQGFDAEHARTPLLMPNNQELQELRRSLIELGLLSS